MLLATALDTQQGLDQSFMPMSGAVLYSVSINSMRHAKESKDNYIMSYLQRNRATIAGHATVDYSL